MLLSNYLKNLSLLRAEEIEILPPESLVGLSKSGEALALMEAATLAQKYEFGHELPELKERVGA